MSEKIKAFNDYEEEIKVVKLTSGYKLISFDNSFLYIGFDQLRALNRIRTGEKS